MSTCFGFEYLTYSFSYWQTRSMSRSSSILPFYLDKSSSVNNKILPFPLHSPHYTVIASKIPTCSIKMNITVRLFQKIYRVLTKIWDLKIKLEFDTDCLKIERFCNVMRKFENLESTEKFQLSKPQYALKKRSFKKKKGMYFEKKSVLSSFLTVV